MEKYVIIGGDAAGMSAAMQIVRNVEQPKIIVLEMGDTFSYAQCGLPYFIAGKVNSSERLIARKEETFREKYGIETRSLHQAEKIDLEDKTVSFTDLLTGQKGSVTYDKLLIATGARPVRPDWPGIELEGVFFLKSIHDAKKIKHYMARNDVSSCLIVGGGYIGLEMAEALSGLGKAVTVIDRNKQLLTAWEPEVADLVKSHMEKKGVTVKLGQSVTGIEGRDGSVWAVSTETETMHADMVLIAVGILPNSDLAAGAGIQIGVKGAIQVNDRMQTSVPNIYAAGDAAVHYHRLKKRDDYIPLGTTANKQGRIAGKNMANQTAHFSGIMGTAVLKVFQLGVARTGLSVKEAEELGYDIEIATIDTKDHADYYPTAQSIRIQLIMQRNTRKLLGAQAVGASGSDKRIDVLATALFHEMTVDQLLDLDLAYSPPFNGVWDPIQQAARRL